MCTFRINKLKLESYKNLSLDLKAIFDTSYNVIYVSDNKGVTLRVSSACKELWGKEEKDLVGKSVYELEKEGIYRPSTTRMVLERKETVSLIQTTHTGKRLKVESATLSWTDTIRASRLNILT